MPKQEDTHISTTYTAADGTDRCVTLPREDYEAVTWPFVTAISKLVRELGLKIDMSEQS